MDTAVAKQKEEAKAAAAKQKAEKKAAVLRKKYEQAMAAAQLKLDAATKAWENKVMMRTDQLHYKRTLNIALAMTYSISRMLKSLPNILAITGGVSRRQKEGKGKTQL